MGFPDVPPGHWAEGAVNLLADAGVLGGFEDGTFRGDQSVTRYQLAAVLAKLAVALGVNHAKTSAVADDPDGTLIRPSDWNAEHAVELRKAPA